MEAPKTSIQKLSTEQLKSLLEIENTVGYILLRDIILKERLEQLKNAALNSVGVDSMELVRQGNRQGQKIMIDYLVKDMLIEVKRELDNRIKNK